MTILNFRQNQKCKMMDRPSSCSSFTSKSRKRPREENEAGDEASAESLHSDSNQEGSIIVGQRIPAELRKWTEEVLQDLSFVVKYDESITPLDLLQLFPTRKSFINSSDYVLQRYIDSIESFFSERLHAFLFLDGEFRTLPRENAEYLRTRQPYHSPKMPTNFNAELSSWYQRFEVYGVQFGKRLYNMVLKRDLVCTDNLNCDLLYEHDFQQLFVDFASMFGLDSYCWCEPSLLDKKLKLPEGTVTGKADILYCLDIQDGATGSFQDIRNVLAVCEVEKNETREDDHSSSRIARNSATSPNSILPPHISHKLLGQHGGELLMYYPYSAKKNDNCIFGMIVQETKMTVQEYHGILSGNQQESRPEFIFTKQYDFMKKDERKYLIRPLLELALMQELNSV